MVLTNNKISFSIFIFGLITNLLILFKIDQFYIRPIFSFLFLTIIPGLILMMLSKIQKIHLWEYLVYTIGLSVAFLMFAGLAVNWILPWLHISDKPLSLFPLLTSFDILLSLFGLIAYKRNKDISVKIQPPKFDCLNKVFFLTPVIFPLLSILGAMTLNNGGSNYLTIIMLSGIAGFSSLIVLLGGKLSKHIYPFVILNFTLALILATSLRSWNIIGHDIVAEYQVFQVTQESLRWSLSSLPGNSYNACLSINILPTIYSDFLSINNKYVFKFYFQIIFSFISVGLYLLLVRYTRPVLAFISVLFFIYFPTFFIDLPMMIRQEVSLLFFCFAF